MIRAALLLICFALGVAVGRNGRRLAAPAIGEEYGLPAGQMFFLIKEVAALLRHSPRQVLDLAKSGAFGPLVDVSGPNSRKGSWTIPRAGLVAFIKKNAH